MANQAEKWVFKLVGGALSLNFVNTVGGWLRSSIQAGGRNYQDAFAVERLQQYADVVEWSRQVKLLTDSEAKRLLAVAEKNPQQAETVHQRALDLRQSIYRLFKAAIEGWKPEAADLQTLNQELSIAREHETINYDRNGFGWQWDNRDEALDCMLWRVAQSAAKVLTAEDLTRLHQCGGDTCGWLFLDTSRNRSRQWCTMQDCGNVAKVRRFRQKKI